MEAHIKRPLKSTERVKHINGDSSDDRIENLKFISAMEDRKPALCLCGCGEEVPVRYGKPHRYIFGHQARGKHNPSYNGGLWIDLRNNRMVIRCRDGSNVYYYRAVMEAHLKRHLSSGEEVHHTDGDPTNDSLENLKLLSKPKHSRLTNSKYTRKELVASIRELARRLNRNPQLKDWDRFPDLPAKGVFYNYFGSWQDALKEAELQ